MKYFKHYYLRLILWLFVVSSFYSQFYVYIQKKLKDNFLDAQLLEIIVKKYGVLLIVTFILLTWLLWILFEQIKKQKINNQPSWVFYFYFSLLLMPIGSFLISSQNINLLSSQFTIRLIIFIFGTLVYFRITPKRNNEILRFAAGAVGIKEDGLEFSMSAKNISEGILSSTEYVSVIALFGATGAGKSSYARMIIENLRKNNILYSYISLTETNEAKDFSNLFLERWYEALEARYPKLNPSPGFALMHSILRDSNQNFCVELINLIPKFDAGLIKTEAKAYDENLGEKPVFVSKNVAKMFNNIPRVKENFWLIMIDEIERSPLAEIYRVIEVIERFKTEGRSGLPLKIVFLLCVSSEFSIRLAECKSNKESFELADLIESFFIKHPKNITKRIFLPPTSKKVKLNFIKKQLQRFVEENNIKWDFKEINNV